MQVEQPKELGEFSVKLFHVANARSGEDVAVQTEEEEEDFDCGDMITARRARGVHAAPPPPRTSFDESWTQTEAKPVRDNQVVFAKDATNTGAQTDSAKARTTSAGMQTTAPLLQETQVRV